MWISMRRKEPKEARCDYCKGIIFDYCSECQKELKLRKNSLVYCIYDDIINTEGRHHFCSERCTKKYLTSLTKESSISI